MSYTPGFAPDAESQWHALNPPRRPAEILKQNGRVSHASADRARRAQPGGYETFGGAPTGARVRYNPSATRAVAAIDAGGKSTTLSTGVAVPVGRRSGRPAGARPIR